MSINSDHNLLFERFKHNMDALSNAKLDAESYWNRRCQEILADARTGSPFEFLRWPSVREISPDEQSSTIYRDCYLELRHSGMWESKWFNLTRDTKVGHPKDFSFDFGTSPILIQHVYHLYLHGNATNSHLAECNIIFEIGGGYGSFCRMLFNSGFKGLYLIYDLPHMSELQRLFLKCVGYQETSVDKLAIAEEASFCVLSDPQLLKQVAKHCESKGANVGFVATWSLSEIPMRVRSSFFPKLHPIFSHYLISYEPVWRGIDNEAYFTRLYRQRSDLSWTRLEIPGSIYLLS
jgi:hypothetical protein